MTQHAFARHLARRRLAAGLLVVGLVVGMGLSNPSPSLAAGASSLTISNAPTSSGVVIEATSSGCSVSVVTDDPEVVLGADEADSCLRGSGLLHIAAGERNVVVATGVGRSTSGALSVTTAGTFTVKPGLSIGGVQTVRINSGGAVDLGTQTSTRTYSIKSGGSVSLDNLGYSVLESVVARGPVDLGSGKIGLGNGGIQAEGWPVSVGTVFDLPGSAGTIVGSVVTVRREMTATVSADELRCTGSLGGVMTVTLVRSTRLGPCSTSILTISSSGDESSAPPDLRQADGAALKTNKLYLGRLGVVDLPRAAGDGDLVVGGVPSGDGAAPQGRVTLGGKIRVIDRLSAGDDVTIRSEINMSVMGAVTAKGALTISAPQLVFGNGSAISSTGNGRVSLLASSRSSVALGDVVLPGGVVPRGLLYGNTNRERWGATTPDPTLDAPYTFYYADSGTARVDVNSMQHDVTSTQLRVAVMPTTTQPAATPTGTVAITQEDGTTLPGCDGLQLDTSGVATCTTRGLAQTVVARTVTARYSPDRGTAYAPANGTATFAVDPGPPSRVRAVGEPSPATRVGTEYAAALTASVVDVHDNPLAGVTVTWSLPSGGPTFAGGDMVASAVSGADGRATSPAVAAGTRAGDYAATASVPGVGAPATWTLKAVPGPATQIAATSGGEQSAAAGKPFASPLVATVSDAYGNTVAGSPVTFTVPGGGAAFADGGATATVTTGDDGRASSPPLSAGSTPGNVTVTGSTVGVADSVGWRLSTVAGAAATVSPIGGGTQSATTGQGFAAPLVAAVTDDRGNPVAGAPVTFTIPSASSTTGAASFAGGRSSALVLTGADGKATSPSITAGGTAGLVTVVGTTPGVVEQATWSLSVAAAGPARADLSVSLVMPTTVARGGVATISAKVTNNGTSAATKLGTTLAVPRGWTVADTGGGTLVGRGLVVFSTAALANKASATYTMRLTAPKFTTASGIVGLTLSGTPDPKLNNNVSLSLVTVR